MYVYVWEHIGSLNYRTALWMFTKLGRDEVLIWPRTCIKVFRPYLPWEDPRKCKQGSRGPLLQPEPLLQTGRLQQQTEQITIILKQVGRGIVLFGSIPKSNFVTRTLYSGK